MRRPVAKRCIEAYVAGFLILLSPAARADSIQSPYTVTDLGSTSSANFWPGIGTDSSGNGTVTGPNGVTYPFVQGPATTQFAGSALAGIPVPDAAPATDMPPGTGFPNSSSANNAFQLPNGIVYAIDQVTQNNGSEYSMFVPFYVQHNADGSWGQPQVIPGSYFNAGPPIGGSFVNIMADKVGDLMVTSQDQENYLQRDVNVTNILTHTTTDISTLPALINSGYSFVNVISMDGDGRILLYANHQSASGQTSEDWVLLTPAGLSSDPINTPEPGSLAVMTLAIAAFAARRARSRKPAA